MTKKVGRNLVFCIIIKSNTVKITEKITIDPEKLKFIASDVNYSRFHFHDGSEMVVSYTLKRIEDKLRNCKNFIRIHKSYIINKDFIESISKNKKETIIKTYDSTEFLVSRRKQKIIKKFHSELLNLMRITLSIFLLLAFFPSSFGQTYYLTRGLPVAETAGSGTAITTLTDNNSTVALQIGFSFNFYGNIYTDFYLNSNGFISFGSGSTTTSITIPSTSNPNNIIAFAATDLNCSVGTPTINYFTTGTSPNRILIINFKNVQHKNNPANLTSVQIKLFEGSTGKIEIHSTSNEAGLNASGSSTLNRTIGIENSTGGGGLTTPDLNNTSTLVANNEMLRFETATTCSNTVSITTPTYTICEGVTTSLLSSSISPTGSFTYQWYRNDIAISGATGATYTASLIGRYYVRIRNSSGTCLQQSNAIGIGRTYWPTISASMPAYVCNSISVNTTPSGTYTYQWYKDNVLISGQTSSSTIPQGAGLYSVRVTSGSCNVTTTKVQVRANSVNSISQNNPPSICGNLQLSADLTSYPGSRSYSWRGPNGFSSTVENPYIQNVTSVNRGVYSVTVNFGCNDSKSNTTNVLIPSNVLNKVSSNSPYVCETINLNSGLNYPNPYPLTYSWTGPNGFTSSLSDVNINNATLAKSGIYTLTANFGCGEIRTATTNVIVQPNTIQIRPRNSNYYTYIQVCDNLILDRIQAGLSPSSYIWRGPNNFSSTTITPTINSVSSIYGGVYSVTATYSCGATSTATANVIVNPLNSLSVTAGGTYTGQIFRCNPINFQTSSLPINSNPTYTWQGPNNFSSTAVSPSIPVASSIHSGTYTVTARLTSCGNYANTGTVNVTVNERTLTINNLDSYSGVCPSSAFTFSAFYSTSVVNGQETTIPTSYLWTGPNSFSSTAQNPTLSNITTNATGIYTLSVNIGNGCKIYTTNTPLLQVKTPTVTASNSTVNNSVCPNTSVTLNADYTWSGGYVSAVYTWTGPNGFTSSLQNPSIILSQATAGTYTVVATFSNCGSSSATTLVSISPFKVATSSSYNGLVCESSSLNLYTYINGSSYSEPPSPTITNYSWAGPNGFISSVRNPSLTNLTTANSGFYTVTVTLSNGCSGTYTSMVGVNVTQNPNLFVPSYSSSFDCANSSKTLYPSTNLLGNTTVSYLWQGPNGFSSTMRTPTINPIGSGGVFTVTATFIGGCLGTYSTLVPVFVNNTPNIFLNSNTVSCLGYTLNLPSVYVSPNTGLTYSWAGPNGFKSSNQTGNAVLVSNNSTAIMAGIYTLTVIDANNQCSQPFIGTTNVTLNTCPCNLSTNSPSICQGSSSNIEAYFSPNNNNISYRWIGPNGYSSNSQYNTVNNIFSTGVYTVTASVTSGACIGTYTRTLTVNIIPPNNSNPSATMTASNTVCEDSRISFSFNNSTSNSDLLNYWITGPNGFNYYGGTFQSYNASYGVSPTNYFDNAKPTMSGIYTVTAYLQGKCNGAYGQQTYTTNITVNSRPALPVISASSSAVNAGESVTLTGTGCASNSLRWLSNTVTNPLIDFPVMTTTYWAVCNPSSNCWSGSSNRIMVTVGNCLQHINLLNPLDNISTGIIIRQARVSDGLITATNQITGTAKATYQAKSIQLNAGFKAENGTVFKAEIGGCN